jgi:hypothetical protein
VLKQLLLLLLGGCYIGNVTQDAAWLSRARSQLQQRQQWRVMLQGKLVATCCHH